MTKTMTTSADISLVGVSASGVFRAYMQWLPNSDQVDNDVTMLNGTAPIGSIRLGTMAIGENTAWQELYGYTKVHKIVVKYYPACTVGMAGVVPSTTVSGGPQPGALSFSANTVMYTVPIYDNVDSVIDSTGKILVSNSNEDLMNMLAKPYAKSHSVYKPWTRVIIPKQYMNYPTFQNSSVYTKRGGYADMSQEILLNGLYITCEQMTVGGLVLDIGDNEQSFPKSGQVFNLGRLETTIYQSFKIRQ